MKTFKRTFLPDEIKYNGKVYIYGERTGKSIKVEVLSRNLKGRTDLYGRPYRPNVHFFNPKPEHKPKISCPNCGNSENFNIAETLGWKAFYDPETNQLDAKVTGNNIESINCQGCNHDCTELFEDITINWQ